MRDARASYRRSPSQCITRSKTTAFRSSFEAWPIDGHNPSDPVRLRQRVEVWADWLARWLR